MDLARIAELNLRFQHRHEDGSMGTFEAEPPHHSANAHDPERDWASGTIYKCSSCDEEIVVRQDDPSVLLP